MTKASLRDAERRCERYNEATAQIERLRERLVAKDQHARRMLGLAYESLPDGYAISVENDRVSVVRSGGASC